MNEIDKAIEHLSNNHVIGIPTETVYGLAGSIESQESIKKIFHTKERPFFDPLIVHVASAEMARPLVSIWPNLVQKLVDQFWPGPLTIVLPKTDKINDLITSGLDSVAIRCPNHPIALELISRFGTPLAAPSANKFTKTSPTTCEHVKSEFGNKVFVLDGGDCEVGIESTVIGVTQDEIKIYRPGMISKNDLCHFLCDENIRIEYAPSPVAPGQLKHHYMPKKPVVLSTVPPKEKNHSVWIVPDSPEIAARKLYSKLRQMDSQDTQKIYIVLKEDFKKNDNWQAFLNRIDKAKSEDYYF